jgi:ectoine hydroxylase
MNLTQEELDRFERDGVLSREAVFNESELVAFKPDLDLLEHYDGPEVVYEAGGRTLRMVHGPHQFLSSFQKLSRHPRLLRPVRLLLGGPVYLYQSRLNLKPAIGSQIAQGYPWHQDFATWHWRDGLPRPDAITVFTFLDDVTACNAPLMTVAGSHRWPLLESDTHRRSGSGADEFKQPLLSPESIGKLADAGSIRAHTGPRGSVVFMHSKLVHGSTENISPLRRALYGVVYAADGNYPNRFKRPSSFVARDFQIVSDLPDNCLLQHIPSPDGGESRS